MDYIYAQYNISSITQMKTVNVQCFLCKISIVNTTIKTKRIVFKFMLKVLISYYVLIHCKMGNCVNLDFHNIQICQNYIIFVIIYELRKNHLFNLIYVTHYVKRYRIISFFAFIQIYFCLFQNGMGLSKLTA